MSKSFNRLFAIAAFLTFTLLTSCNDKESDLGINLVDGETSYVGIADTLTLTTAWSELEDSMLTSNYSYGIIGNYHDNTFGKVSSTLYTQIALPSSTNNQISFDEAIQFDSAILSLANYSLYPDTGRTYNFHFEVMQLAEPVLDTSYYSTDALPVNPSTKFFDGPVSVCDTDTVVSMTLSPSFFDILRVTATAEEFLEHTKGLRIRITDAGDEGMMGIDFSSATTCLKVYYHYTSDTLTTNGFFTFLMGAGTAHFTNFTHDYSGTLFAGTTKVSGNNRLYLEPFAGHQIRLNFDNALQTFRQAHPYAVIHHAELLLNVAPESDDDTPDMILTLYRADDSTNSYIPDMMNTYTLLGYDGSYNREKHHYRMRISQHLQEILRKGKDPGFVLLLNSRRHAAQRAIFYGSGTPAAPKIAFTYSE